MRNHFFISGIDTDCGKTFITGLLARTLFQNNVNCITSKFIQTGCLNTSEDIEAHRKAMGIDLLPEDKNGTTCPIIYTFPASPHLSAVIDKKEFDINIVIENIEKLKSNYEILLTEGAGGLTVPLTKSFLTSDFLKESKTPVILVTSSKLGSLNHTILSIEYCKYNAIDLVAIIYNEFPDDDSMIANDSYHFIDGYLKEKHPDIKLLHSDEINNIENVLDILQ